MAIEHKEAGAHPAYDTQPAGWEKKLDEVFRKQAPFQLPASVTKWLGDNAWWIVLVGAVLSVLGVLSTYNTMNLVGQTGMYFDNYAYPGVSASFEQSKNMMYVTMISSIIAAVLLFLASSKLKTHQKSGWNLLYYNFLINAGLSLIGSLVFSPATFVFSLIGFVVGFVIGAYILFQVRPRFTK